ncbi:CD99 molecule isoform X2 [Periophthalmus magnuspinnatus]|uniref:CD99 molecule isoform X2 n=1 Tax=Periophthalmus magnuspinnatus TaxID=409849 RepID=UPI002436A8B3|nr:CD99 molecule isoform X2 [Periophthalmus magnuspinnatus]
MKLFFRIAGLFLLLSGTLAQDMNFDLADALDDGPKVTAAPPKKDKDMTFDLSDAFGDDDPVPTKPPVVAPPSGGGGGGGTLKDTDLFDVGGGGGGYEPDGGRSGGRGMDPEYNPNSGGGDQAQGAELEWAPLLKMLYANVPEDFFIWMSNFRHKLAPVLERVLDLLYSLPGEDKQEL